MTLVVIMASCNFIYDYEKCDPDDSDLILINDWSLAPDATPCGMAFVFFAPDERYPWRFDFPGREAGRVRMPFGDYSMISFNDDSDSILFHTESYATFEAYTRATALPAPFTTGEPVVESPDMLWGCAYSTVKSSERIIYALQRPITAIYIWEIVDVENLDGVQSMSAALSGMAGGWDFSVSSQSVYPVTQTFKAYKSGSDTIAGAFHSFGIPPEPSQPNILKLFVRLHDGRELSYEFDVTDQICTAPNPMLVHIRIAGLKITPSEIGHGGAFDVAVDGWTTVNVNIID